jgi:hypothetical protein
VASDGVNAVTLTGDPLAGLQLFSATLGGGPIFDGGSLAAAPVAGVSAANCGPDCILASWIYGDGGGTTPAYAFLSAQGCGQGALFIPTDGGATPEMEATAVAAQPGGAAIATAITTYTQPNCGAVVPCYYETFVYVALCTP